jgi:hypothetical protein
MGRLYQRIAGRALGAILLAVAAAGCGPPERADPAAGPPPATWPLGSFLDTVEHRLAAVDEAGRALADEVGTDGTRVVRVAAGRPPEPLAPGLAASHRFVAALPAGRVLVEVAAAGGGPPALALLEAGIVRPLAAAGAGERLLGVAPDGQVVRLARDTASGEEIVELRLAGLARRTLTTVPAGFRAAAITGDGLALALVRAVHDGADEVILHDRRKDERRLLLPTDSEGRFRPLAFEADGSALWFEGDDASDQPRLERLALPGGERRVVLERSCVDALPFAVMVPTTVESGCDGRRSAAPIGAPPRWRELALPASLGAGARVVRARPAGPQDDWLELAGAATTGELARLPADLLLVPATRGLAPRLDPARLPAPAAVDLGLGGAAAELWAPDRTAVGGVVWLLPLEQRPDLGRFAPYAAFLASRGVATLRIVPRGAPGTGRAARAATDGDPVAATAGEVARALSVLRGRGVAGLPMALVGEGAWSGAIAAEIAARPGSGFALAVALDPDADPLSSLDRVAAAPEPVRARGVARWGDPAAPHLVERRAELATAATRPAIPLLVVLDSALASTPARVEALEAARAAGAPVRPVTRVRPAFASGPDRRALEETWRHLRERFAPPAAAP